MQKGLIGLASAIALVSVAASGCGSPTQVPGSGGSNGSGSGGSSSGGSNGSASGGSNGTGGKTGSGGSASGGSGSGSGGSTGQTCPNVTPCGGDVVGTWNVTTSCQNVAGEMDTTLIGIGCPSLPVVGTLKVTGTWTADAAGNYTDGTTTTGMISLTVAPKCKTLSSTPVECTKLGSIFEVYGWTMGNCTDTSDGGCACTAVANQKGALGVINMDAAKTGAYTTSNNNLNTDEIVDYAYCVSGKTLTLTPKPTLLPISGTIVLEKTGTSTGSGGMLGGGGMTGSGGTSPGSGGAAGGRSGSASGGAPMGGRGGGTAGGTGGAAGGSSGNKPCDIYASASTACVAAHSTVRALYGAYSGNLYQVKRADGMTKDIGVTSPGGFADAAAQDAFCTTACTITKIYDQSGHGNFVEAETPDSSVGGYSSEKAASATAENIMVGGHKVYSLKTKSYQAYWRDGSKSGMPVDSAPQGIYMVTSGKYVSNGCCFDYGNGETGRKYVSGPSMDALYFGTSTQWGSGAGSGPWIMADLEGGIYASSSSGKNSNLPSMPYTFVTDVEKNNGTSEFALRGADATTGTALSTLFKGKQPGGYAPNKKQGSIVLGSGGDCCYSNGNASYGVFYEGAIVAGYPSDATEDAIQVNVVTAGYGK